MARRMKNGWRYVVTKIVHTCNSCGQEIPAGANCLSKSYYDALSTKQNKWYTVYLCPASSCHLPPDERQVLLFPKEVRQEKLAF